MFRKKRGQVTLIVILAILIFFIMIMLLGARAKAIKTQMNLAATKQIHAYVDQSAIKQYVTSCLNSVSEEVMVQAAMQAGVFDFTDMTLNKDYVKYTDPIYNRTFNVSIIIPDNYQCPIIRHTPSAYPFENLSLSLLEGKYIAACGNNRRGYFASYSGFFGLNNYTRLCAWNGSNRPGATSSGFSAYTCMGGTYNYFSTLKRVPTFQERMQEEISKRMKECVNTTFLQTMYPSNISMLSEPETIVTFGERGITMTTAYPFLLEIEKREPIQRMINFSVTRDIPFKNMYNYVFNLIQKDVSEYDYDKFNGSGQVAVYDYYVVNRTTLETADIANPPNKIIIDVIQIFDNQTSIQSNPLIFSYAVINRRPALDYIHVSGSDEYDIVALENDTLRLSPIGYDPDEDGIVYNYSLWWEDYNETYDFGKSDCLSVTSIEYMKNKCMIGKDIMSYPRNWTNSTKFQATGREAEKYIQKSDTGFHIVNISIWDRELLRDWQEVRILVTDMPVARVNATNFYEEFPNNVTSYEDPYLLDGSGSTVGWGQLNVFIWNDTSYNDFVVTKYVASQGKLLLIPNETGTSVLVNADHSIADIAPNKNDGDSLVFIRPPKPDARFNGSIYNITLTVIASAPSGRQNTKLFPVDVKQCLPHKNKTNPAYPYNKEQPDNYWGAFYANHTCCLDDYRYAPDTQECYQYDSWGGYKSFDPNLWERGESTIYPENTNNGFKNNFALYRNIDNNPIGAANAQLSEPNDNDIYHQTFERNCSGYRGNICGGNATETRIAVENCNDVNIAGPKDTRCSGPPGLAGGIWPNSLTEVYCENYTGAPFEHRANSISTDSCFGNNNYCVSLNYQFASQTTDPLELLCLKGDCDGIGGCSANIQSCSCSNTCDENIPSQCEGKQPNTDINCILNNNAIPERCGDSSGCSLIIDGGNQGRCLNSPSKGCNSAIACNNLKPGEHANSFIATEICSNTCNSKDCKGFKYDITIDDCKTHCVSGNDCLTSAGYQCRNIDPITGKGLCKL
ncbi:MAG: hypothetical protein WC916_07025 [Candidatus Woesearchaeota archaeon]